MAEGHGAWAGEGGGSFDIQPPRWRWKRVSVGWFYLLAALTVGALALLVVVLVIAFVAPRGAALPTPFLLAVIIYYPAVAWVAYLYYRLGLRDWVGALACQVPFEADRAEAGVRVALARRGLAAAPRDVSSFRAWRGTGISTLHVDRYRVFDLGQACASLHLRRGSLGTLISIRPLRAANRQALEELQTEIDLALVSL